MAVRSWRYTFPNWVYDALSRVRTFEGLFICGKIDETKMFHVYPKLSKTEDILLQFRQELMNF